jgi:hypothetical protein
MRGDHPVSDIIAFLNWCTPASKDSYIDHSNRWSGEVSVTIKKELSLHAAAAANGQFAALLVEEKDLRQQLADLHAAKDAFAATSVNVRQRSKVAFNVQRVEEQDKNNKRMREAADKVIESTLTGAAITSSYMHEIFCDT